MDTKTTQGSPDTGILFSRTVKAGQRIYYVDVKENRRGEKYLSITESKKMVSNDEENPHVSYEKHKIFLFPEDFQKFMECMEEAMDYAQGHSEAPQEADETEAGEIHIDMDFSAEM
ncbi:MAG: DUF3276 family protein [Bacteroidaceae bacterium]|nr:PUR family DNA/RNA-binding protein [Paraprevotella sp.]MDY3099280.1 DUF3276 family protein [Bacteroidaceae bacterium]MCI6743501.1 PUR family DNA/RNA-binding protein [Paraprevotella sp.]MCI7081835.1 PUR family DNA/RNA-binding protein [Paraprevotella sp.]MDD5970382.1 DUF3276 family protein [Paraprevotella sp.]